MKRQNDINRLQLKNYFALDHNVDPISAIQSNTLIDNRQCDLPCDRDARFPQFITEALLICRLQQTWSQMPVHFNRTPNDSLRQFLVIRNPLCHSFPRLLSPYLCASVSLAKRVVQSFPFFGASSLSGRITRLSTKNSNIRL